MSFRRRGLFCVAARFGNTSGLGGASTNPAIAVPEPSTLALGILAAAAAGRRLRSALLSCLFLFTGRGIS